jgi:hypothetical protein
MLSASKLSVYFSESGWKILSAGAATAVLIGAVKFSAVSLLLYLHTPRTYLKLQDAVLTGLLAAAVVCVLLQGVNRRRKFVRREIQSVANLNHDLRNALEVIVGSEYLSQWSQGDAILESVERIDRALNKILDNGAQATRR